MKATYRTANGRISFEVSGEAVKDVFREIARVQEVFDAHHACGMCKSVDIAFRVRTVEDDEYFEVICKSCYARFEFGQNKKGGGLFPKRKDKSGEHIPNNGWSKYQKPGAEADKHLRDEDVGFDPGPAPAPRSARR